MGEGACRGTSMWVWAPLIIGVNDQGMRDGLLGFRSGWRAGQRAEGCGLGLEDP